MALRFKISLSFENTSHIYQAKIYAINRITEPTEAKCKKLSFHMHPQSGNFKGPLQVHDYFQTNMMRDNVQK